MATVEQVQNVTRRMSEEKATMLAREAVELSRAGYKDEASRRLRAAASLGPENPDVQAAFSAIHNEERRSPLLDLCRKYTLYHDQKAGEEAIKYLRSSEAPNAASSALECIQLLLESVSTTLDASQDAIIAELSNRSIVVRRYLARELKASTTEFFENLYERGDDAANCLRSVVLDQTLWDDEDSRLHVEDELFQLFLAKLMESGHDHDGRALKGIALLLIADTQRLHAFVDEDGFDALLSSLDYRLPPDVRGQATLVLSKFLEVSEGTGQQYFTKFVKEHVAKGKGENLILAFSAAAQFFPLASTLTAQLFLTEGFLPSILPLLERNATTTNVHGCFLALLNAACIDAACRQAIAQYCSAWLSHKVSNGKDKQPSMAATVLAKLRTSGAKPNGQDQRAANTADDDVSELVDLFIKTLTLSTGRNVSDSIEGLAYTSLKPEVKEKLANSGAFLKELLHELEENSTIPEIVVGALSIISNLTHYPPNLTEEQKKMTQLKAYANASKPSEASPLEDEDHIKKRCTALVDAGLMPTLVKINRVKSSSTHQLSDQVLLSLSRNPKDRGKLAQQGAVKLLVQHAQKDLQQQKTAARAITASSTADTTSTPTSTSSPLATSDAPHALARLLISLNPAHVFTTSTPHITDAVPPLVSLLHSPGSATSPLAASNTDTQAQDRLATFEALLALTNLASHPSGQAAELIIRLGFPQIEDLLLHDNVLLRRAAVELLCNICVCDGGAGKFADGSARAKGRLKVLLALADVEDLPTRRAAGGALAVLSEREAVSRAILEAKRGAQDRNTGEQIDSSTCWGVERVLDLVADEEDQGVVVRGLVVLGNLCEVEGGLDAVKAQNGAEIVKAALKRTRDEQVLEVGVQVLKRLMGV